MVAFITCGCNAIIYLRFASAFFGTTIGLSADHLWRFASRPKLVKAPFAHRRQKGEAVFLSHGCFTVRLARKAFPKSSFECGGIRFGLLF
jgi:hypothetical protein